MANSDHVNAFLSSPGDWRKHVSGSVDQPDFRGADLSNGNFSGADLVDADLRDADLSGSDMYGSFLMHAKLHNAKLDKVVLNKSDVAFADFSGASLVRARLDDLLGWNAIFYEADLSHANLSRSMLVDASFIQATLHRAWFDSANLGSAKFMDADLAGASLTAANLSRAVLSTTNLTSTDFNSAILTDAALNGADLTSASLSGALMIRTILTDAILKDCWVYGTSVWDVVGEPQIESGLRVSAARATPITVDDLKVAQFVYLISENHELRDVIDSVGKKGVLVLGRFTERKHVLEAIRGRLSESDLLPIVFDFERPNARDFTETVLVLAGMCRFIVADITAPKSVPLESKAIIPNYRVPFVPIIESGERPFSMFKDLWLAHRDWVLEPLYYDSVAQLMNVFQPAVIDEANKLLEALRRSKAEEMLGRLASDYLR